MKFHLYSSFSQSTMLWATYQVTVVRLKDNNKLVAIRDSRPLAPFSLNQWRYSLQRCGAVQPVFELFAEAYNARATYQDTVVRLKDDTDNILLDLWHPLA